MVTTHAPVLRPAAVRRRTARAVLGSMALLALLVSAVPAEAQRARARLSRDLAARLDAGATGAVDVIITGTPVHVERIAKRHGAVIKKWLKSGAVLTLNRAGLSTLADDADAGAVSSD